MGRISFSDFPITLPDSTTSTAPNKHNDADNNQAVLELL